MALRRRRATAICSRAGPNSNLFNQNGVGDKGRGAGCCLPQDLPSPVLPQPTRPRSVSPQAIPVVPPWVQQSLYVHPADEHREALRSRYQNPIPGGDIEHVFRQGRKDMPPERSPHRSANLDPACISNAPVETPITERQSAWRCFNQFKTGGDVEFAPRRAMGLCSPRYQHSLERACVERARSWSVTRSPRVSRFATERGLDSEVSRDEQSVCVITSEQSGSIPQPPSVPSQAERDLAARRAVLRRTLTVPNLAAYSTGGRPQSPVATSEPNSDLAPKPRRRTLAVPIRQRSAQRLQSPKRLLPDGNKEKLAHPVPCTRASCPVAFRRVIQDISAPVANFPRRYSPLLLFREIEAVSTPLCSPGPHSPASPASPFRVIEADEGVATVLTKTVGDIGNQAQTPNRMKSSATGMGSVLSGKSTMAGSDAGYSDAQSSGESFLSQTSAPLGTSNSAKRLPSSRHATTTTRGCNPWAATAIEAAASASGDWQGGIATSCRTRARQPPGFAADLAPRRTSRAPSPPPQAPRFRTAERVEERRAVAAEKHEVAGDAPTTTRINRRS